VCDAAAQFGPLDLNLLRIVELEDALLRIFQCTYEGDPVRAIAEQALQKSELKT
jgi:hypothetical protein